MEEVARREPANRLEIAIFELLRQAERGEGGEHPLARLRERGAVDEQLGPHPRRLLGLGQGRQEGGDLSGGGEVLGDEGGGARKAGGGREGEHRVDAVEHQLRAVAGGEEMGVHVERFARPHLLSRRVSCELGEGW